MSTSKLIVALLAALLGVAVTVSLGNWQTRRGDAKRDIQQRWAAADNLPARVIDPTSAPLLTGELPQKVRVSGRFVGEATVYLPNRIRDGRPGFLVVTPLDIGGRAPWVLVNRGWKEGSPLSTQTVPATPSNVVTIDGLAVERAPRLLDLGDPPSTLPGAWQNLDYDNFERVSGRRVARFVVQQTGGDNDDLQRTAVAPVGGVDRHRGYALQWYSMAALIAVLTMFFTARAIVQHRRKGR